MNLGIFMIATATKRRGDSGILRKIADMEEYRMNYGDFAKTPRFDGFNRYPITIPTAQVLWFLPSYSPAAQFLDKQTLFSRAHLHEQCIRND